MLTSVAVLAYRDLPQLRRPLGQDRSGTTEPLFISIVGVALAVVALGALPFTFYFYTTQGPGDRVLYLSSIASSVILGALFERALQARRETAMAVLAPLLLVVGVQRWDKAADWDWAGDEGVAILSTIHDRFPAPPTGAIVIGPEPVSRGNLAPFVDHSNIRGAMAVLYPGAGVDAYVAHDRASFEQFEEQYRFDLVAIANDMVELTGP
ncbi:MAG: hypothetical protein R2710_30455 [Acidimicrobiales bacterium]